MNFQLISNVAVIITSVGIACAYLYVNFVKGKSELEERNEQSDLNTLGYLRGQIEGLQGTCESLKNDAIERQKTHAEEMKKMHGEVENMKGQLTQKDVIIEQYRSLFQGGDSEIIKVLKQVSDTMGRVEKIMIQNAPALIKEKV